MGKLNKVAFFALAFILLNSCSVKKDRFTSRFYHRLNAHYNAWFNGNESLKEGVASLQKAHQDNYMKVLPVFKYGNEQNAQAVAANMDKALSKATIVIKRHSMVFKKTERNRWIGESYMLIGKGNFYKQNYIAAKQTFEYVASHHKNEPVKYEASLWLARTYNQMHQYPKAQPQLDIVENKLEKSGRNITIFDKIFDPFVRREIPLSVYKELPMIYADYYIQQENYNPSIEHLRRAIEVNHKKKIRSRLTFILAQIYQKSGDLKRATKYYSKVLKLNPSYEMAFNSKMNMANCYDASNSDSRSIKKELLKMAKDIKNKDYLDQIYYALAEISIKEKNMPDAVKYLKLSAKATTTNNNQKALTYLKLADIYFAKPDYINAAAYYDSTMTILPKDYADYQTILNKKNTIVSLAKNLVTVQFEDSVQLFAKMTEKERNAKIDKIIHDIVKKEEEKKQAELNKQINQTYYGDNTEQFGGQQNSAAWYFYNPNSVRFGIADFAKKWGNRPLEDNWFLSNKKQEAFSNNEEATTNVKADSSKTDSTKASAKKFDPKDRNSYLQNIPLTSEKLKKSNERIEEALYNLGFIYKEGLKEYKKSADAFEDLIKRYPDTKYLASSCYQLYKTYDEELNNKTKAEYYKNMILTKFPDSKYANMLKDPDYAKHQQGNRSEAAILYNDTYQAYIDKQYDKVIQNSNKALMSFKGDNLMPKFEFLKALSIGRTSDIKAFTDALNDIVKKYPDDRVKQEAQDMLNYIANKDKKQEAQPGANNKIPFQFAANTEAIHFYIMVVDAKEVNLKDIKNAISDFDLLQFSLEKLNISTSFLGSERQIVTVSNFENQEAAMRYYNAIKVSPEIEKALKGTKFQQFTVTTENYTALFKTKDVEGYAKFFEENYLK